MSYVIYNKNTGEILRAKAQSVGMYIKNYKTESAAKAALTRLDKKGLLGGLTVMNPDSLLVDHVTPYVKDNFAIADGDTYREIFPVKMVERVNLRSGKTYMEAEDTPRSCSPASELYWSM